MPNKKLKREYWKQSLWISFIALVIDQIYHIAMGLTHQIFDILNPETRAYIGLKFFVVFIVSWLALKYLKHGIIALSVIIGITSAFIFSPLINYLFPYAYGFGTHLFHFFAIAIGVFATLKYISKINSR